MKLTPKQKELIEEYKSFEAQYGKGNIFIRGMSYLGGTCFLYHEVGMENVKIVRRKIDARIVTALDKKGLLCPYDNEHRETNPNFWRDKPAGWFCVGLRVKTELLSRKGEEKWQEIINRSSLRNKPAAKWLNFSLMITLSIKNGNNLRKSMLPAIVQPPTAWIKSLNTGLVQ